MLERILFKIARSRFSRYFIGYTFARLSFLMPLSKVIDVPDVLVFHHPAKYWDCHILIVPKRAIPSFTGLTIMDNPTHQNLLLSIIQAARDAAKMEGLLQYALLVNGGTYQDVPQIHFHLVSGIDRNGTNSNQNVLRQLPDIKELIFESSTIDAYQFPESTYDLHIAIVSKEMCKSIQELDFETQENKLVVVQIFELARVLVKQLKPAGYTILTHSGYDQKVMVFQILGTTALR